MAKVYLSSTEKVAVNNYPYGRLRTTAFFSLEHKAGKGFRTVFQTINPKTGRLNAPKYSTYAPILAMYRNTENDHISYDCLRMHSADEINRAAEFMAANFSLYTPDMIKAVCLDMLSYIKGDCYTIVVYCGAKMEDIKAFYEPSIKALVEGCKSGDNIFSDVKIDVEGLNSKKDPNFNPFKVTSYTTA